MQLSAFATFKVPNDPFKQIIKSGERFEEWLRFLIGRPLVLDYETSGLNYYQKAVAVGIGLGSWDDQGRFWSSYVPFRHMTGEPQMDIQVVGPGIKSLLECPDTLKIAHNIKFEDHFSRKEGWKLSGRRYDTMIAAHIYDENNFTNLENRAATDLGLGKNAYQGKNMINSCVKGLAKDRKMKIKEYKNIYGYAEVPVDICGYYCCFDVTHCGNLCSFYESKNISSTYSRIFNTEMELTEALCDTEENGLPLNVSYLESLRESKLQKMEEAEIKFKTTMGGKSIAFGSDDQVRDFMAFTLGLTWDKLTDKNKLSVDREVIERFAREYSVLQNILNWRDASKIVSTYTTSLIKLCDSHDVLHGNLQQMGTVTGRLSCRDPNYQNMVSGPEVRQAFHVRGKGWVRLFLDYSQIELRVLAFYSRDPIMVDVYLKNGDIHARTQKEVSLLLRRDVPRRHAKLVNFGLNYGLSAKGLAAQSGMPLNEAENFMQKFFERYKGIDDFRKELCAYARRNGNLVSNLFGRTRRISDLQSNEGWKRGSAERRLIGSIIQGQAAELTKESMVRIARWIKETKVEAYLVNTVHDEIQLDMPKNCLPYVLQNCKVMMEDYPEFSPIPVVVDAEVADLDWGHKWAIVDVVNPDEPNEITLQDFMARPTLENVKCQVVG